MRISPAIHFTKDVIPRKWKMSPRYSRHLLLCHLTHYMAIWMSSLITWPSQEVWVLIYIPRRTLHCASGVQKTFEDFYFKNLRRICTWSALNKVQIYSLLLSNANTGTISQPGKSFLFPWSQDDENRCSTTINLVNSSKTIFSQAIPPFQKSCIPNYVIIRK